MFKRKPCKFILRKRVKLFAIAVVILSCVFIFYQLFYFKQLNEHMSTTSHNLVRGTHIKQAMLYAPGEKNQFVCIYSREIIDFSKVNDDYCDCLDGSDEPGTNACSNGIFFCVFQDAKKVHRNVLPSTMVNDGICDCCDGSDEWNSETLPFRLDDKLQRKLGRYQTPCPNICFH